MNSETKKILIVVGIGGVALAGLALYSRKLMLEITDLKKQLDAKKKLVESTNTEKSSTTAAASGPEVAIQEEPSTVPEIEVETGPPPPPPPIMENPDYQKVIKFFVVKALKDCKLFARAGDSKSEAADVKAGDTIGIMSDKDWKMARDMAAKHPCQVFCTTEFEGADLRDGDTEIKSTAQRFPCLF